MRSEAFEPKPSNRAARAGAIRSGQLQNPTPPHLHGRAEFMGRSARPAELVVARRRGCETPRLIQWLRGRVCGTARRVQVQSGATMEQPAAEPNPATRGASWVHGPVGRLSSWWPDGAAARRHALYSGVGGRLRDRAARAGAVWSSQLRNPTPPHLE